METQCESDSRIIRSGTRIRESIRCLPKGHFQHIRQMFDKQSSSTKQLSTIYERRQQKPPPSYILLELPVTDDEKLQHTTNIDDVVIENNKSYKERYLSDYPVFHRKLLNKSFLKPEQPLLEATLSLPIENHLVTGKKHFVFKNKCNHLIECQRPVLSHFIDHQGSMRRGKKENCKKKQETIWKVDIFFLFISHEIRAVRFIILVITTHERWRRINIRMLRDNREKRMAKAVSPIWSVSNIDISLVILPSSFLSSFY